MILNYLKIAWRSIKKDKLFSSINIFGMSIGIAITVLLVLFVLHEQSFDTMHSKRDSIYRLSLQLKEDRQNQIWANVPPVAGGHFKREIPEIEASARMLKHNFGKDAIVTVNNNHFVEKYWYWVDPDLLHIFDIPLLQGNPSNVLTKPKTVIISQSTANLYFGKSNPVGQTLMIDNNIQLEITGVFKDFPSNSTLDCNVIASSIGYWFDNSDTWNNASFQTFVLLSSNANRSSIEQKINQSLTKAVDKESLWYRIGIQPLSEIHLYSENYKNSYNSRKGSIKEVKILSGLAVLILIIACINYTNLMTARSQKRAKDVGINKTLGATVKGLVLRFFVETGLVTAIALVFGVILAFFAVPVFETLTGKQLHIESMASLPILGVLILVWLVSSLISGVYPALYLSKFSPIEVLKPTKSKGVGSVFTRKSLVVFQFCVSVVLIVSVLVIQKQLHFMKNKDLGYNPEEVLIVSLSGVHEKDQQDLSTRFQSFPEVFYTALAQGYPSMRVSGRTLFKNQQDKQGLSLQTNVCEGDVVNVLELNLLAGKMLPKVKATNDSIVDVVLNKKAVEYLGLSPEEAVGKRVDMMLGENAFVCGVVDDFNFESLRQPISGYAFHNGKNEPKRYLLVRFHTQDIPSSIQKFDTAFKDVSNNYAFQFQFLDNNTQKLYEKEQQTAHIGIAFCGLAIFIACLGLFGLAAFTAEQRTKEIGVRKVLGASVFGITQLLTADFIKLVVIGFFIGFPLAYLLMNSWLQNFAYRTSFGITEFIITGIVALLIALATVSFHAIRAARANPTKSLKTE